MLRRAVLWGAALAAMFWLVRGYAVRDPDSLLYDMISQRLSQQPVGSWIAPQYPADWPTNRGPFAEHFATLFWPAAALGRLGLHGALCANFLWVLASYALLFRLALALAGKETAWAAVLCYAVSPVGVQYLVRANHEPALACAYFGALWCAATSRPLFLALFLALAVAIKGGLGLAVLPVALVGWWVGGRRRADLFGVAFGCGLIALFVAAYELSYRHVTGVSFLALYLDRQLGGVAMHQHTSALNLLLTPAYYLGSVAWFALPGSALVLYELVTRRKAPLKGALYPALTLLAGLSPMARRAVRYVFPAYGLCNAAGAQVLLERFPRVREALLRHERLLEPALALFTVIATALRVAI